MKQIDVKQLVDQNMRLNFLVGVMFANMEKPQKHWRDWIIKAIEAVCYNDGPLPEMPNDK